MSVPYYEGLNGIAGNNQLPPCWSATAPGASCLTFTSAGNGGYAAFSITPAGQSHFFSAPVFLKAGVVYSVSTWVKAQQASGYGWVDFSVMIGTMQSTTGLQTLTSVMNPSMTVYVPVGITFTIGSTGVYYFAVRATSSGSGSSQLLHWDDLSVIIPCDLNAPLVQVAKSAATVCVNETVILSASGADTYTWSSGGSGDTILWVSSVPGNIFFKVDGQDTLSGCMSTYTSSVFVNPEPQIAAYVNPQSVCAGNSASLVAFGAQTYTWNTGSWTSTIAVTPPATTSYTVTGFNQFGCHAQSVAQVQVLSLPTVMIMPLPPFICINNSSVITASGALTYTWTFDTDQLLGNPVIYTFPSQETMMLIKVAGKDGNGCVNTSTATLHVWHCHGISEAAYVQVLVYPNPTDGMVNVRCESDLPQMILVNSFGQQVAAEIRAEDVRTWRIDLSPFPEGIYTCIVEGHAHKILKVRR